jgi:hypothetical protein
MKKLAIGWIVFWGIVGFYYILVAGGCDTRICLMSFHPFVALIVLILTSCIGAGILITNSTPA